LGYWYWCYINGDLFRMFDILLLVRADKYNKYNDGVLWHDIKNHRKNIEETHITEVLDEFLTLIGGHGENYTKGYQIYVNDGIMMIIQSINKVLSLFYFIVEEYQIGLRGEN